MPDQADTQTPTPQAQPHCPHGDTPCQFLDELHALRAEVAALTEQVHTDTLTGIANFRHFRQVLDQEMERTRRTGQATALVMVDLDFFKKVNDTWGHEVGNQALIQTAKLLTQATRRLDTPCRYGGEEFAIILPSTELITAIQVAERLRSMIESTPLIVGEKSLPLTASLGVDTYRTLPHAATEESAEDFIKRTDEQLYRAKHEGRNRVCHGITPIADKEANVSAEEKDALFGLFGNDDSGDKKDE